jgi:hypothetical protein
MMQLPASVALLPLGQVSTNWMTSWLTPIWFLAAGIAIGLIALAIFVVLVKLLSNIPVWEQLSRSSAGHAVAALITALLAGGIWSLLPESAVGDSALQEPMLIGIGLVLVSAIVGWAIVFCSSAQASKNAYATLSEGAAGYLRVTALIVVFFGAAIWVTGVFTQPIVDQPLRSLASIPQVFSSGEKVQTFTLDGVSGDESEFVPVFVDVDRDSLQSISFTSSGTVILADAANTQDVIRAPFRLVRSETVSWGRTKQKVDDLPIPFVPGEMLYVQNQEVDKTELTVLLQTQAAVPEAYSLISTALVVLLIGMAILLQQAMAPRVSAVSHATLTNELAQPLFLVLMMLGTVLIILYQFLSFNTFGEDIKLLKDCGIMTIMLLAAFQGVWSASSSISEEIEGKTALTVLSKPIQRRSFIIGKFMGIFWVLLLMFVILGAIELVAVSYKPIYDARENALEMPNWQVCHAEVMATMPGLAMAFMQAIVLTAISVALATRLPQLANLAICFSIYVIGNLSTVFVSSTQEAFPIVKFIAQLIATIVPILEHFQLQAAIDAGNSITISLLSGSLIYCLLYVMLAMFLALLMFEDRDLA